MPPHCDPDRPLRIDIGVLVPSAAAEAQAQPAVALFSERLRADFPGLDWRLHVRVASGLAASDGAKAIELLELGAEQLEREHSDFVLVLAPGPLADEREVSALAVSSQLLACGVVALADHSGSRRAAAGGEPTEPLSSARLGALLWWTFACLNDLRDEAERALAGGSRLAPEARDKWYDALQNVADERLEESAGRRGRVGFYSNSTLINLREIGSAVLRTRPWLFPVRLSKMTAGAVSTVLVVLLTAETWELAGAQPIARAVLAAAIVLVFTVFYLLRQQDILARVHRNRLTERRVIAEVATVVGVTLGLFSTFLMLLAISGTIGWLLFPARVVGGWLGGSADALGYSSVGLLSATIGITVGTLGASLEAPRALRFVVSVDSVLRRLPPGGRFLPLDADGASARSVSGEKLSPRH